MLNYIALHAVQTRTATPQPRRPSCRATSLSVSESRGCGPNGTARLALHPPTMSDRENPDWSKIFSTDCLRPCRITSN